MDAVDMEADLDLSLGRVGTEPLRRNSSCVWPWPPSSAASSSMLKVLVSQLPLSLLWNLCRHVRSDQ